MTNFRLALNLEQYQQKALDESPGHSHALLDLPYLAEIVEEMLLPRYHLIDDEAWSQEALEFFSCCLSGSIETLLTVRIQTNHIETLVLMIQHSFVAQAKSASKLAPRVRFAIEFQKLTL